MCFVLFFISLFVYAAKGAEDKVCDSDLGCFRLNEPFVPRLPTDPKKIDVKFKLYTKENQDDAQHLSIWNIDSVRDSYFNSSKPTKFVVHGFLDDSTVGWVLDMKDAILFRDDLNLFLVDWSSSSKTLDYNQAAADIRVVGAKLARFIIFLRFLTRADEKDMHIIGHSLGAHVAGYAGERLNGRLGRITGLDPAYPFFENTPPEVRLDTTDAMFVDVIHTDADADHKLGFGMEQAIGHLDFYPNGGLEQPGCGNDLFDYMADQGVIQGGTNYVICNHQRAIQLFTESVNSDCSWTSYPCDSWRDFKDGKCLTCGSTGCFRMGYDADKNVLPRETPTKKLFLTTSDKYPYCHEEIHQVKVKIGKNKDATTEEAEELFVQLKGEQAQSDSVNVLSYKSNTKITPGDSYGFVVGSRQPLGAIRSMDIRWIPREESWYMDWYSSLTWWLNDQPPSCVFLEKVEVSTAGEKECEKFEFNCGAQEIVSKKTETLEIGSCK